MRCFDCDHFFYNGESGECRRYAPKPKEYAEGPVIKAVVPSWPLVEKDDWCGEYSERGRG